MKWDYQTKERRMFKGQDVREENVLEAALQSIPVVMVIGLLVLLMTLI